MREVKEIVKIVVFVPVEAADKLRKAIGKVGAGKIGNYEFASFSSRGVGRFRPLEGAHPAQLERWENLKKWRKKELK